MSNIYLLPGVRFGATPEDWGILAPQYLENLLPVVCNPGATISPGSRMKAVGKTPSNYNAHGHAVGVAGWVRYNATVHDIKRWANVPDLGISVSTRKLRALDVDIPDPDLADAVYDYIRNTLDLFTDAPIACRYRSNSSKFLLAFEVDHPSKLQEQYAKRILKTKSGMIEFLAHGQQFVAVGMHQSGVRYAWENGDHIAFGPRDCPPKSFPVIDHTVWETLWQGLARNFGVEPPVHENPKHSRILTRMAHQAKLDHVADYLEGNDFVISYHNDGRLNIVCPFDDEHTSDTGETSTQYFPAGVGGFDRGHFKCLHAHCAGRSDRDFMEKIGFSTLGFEDESKRYERGEIAVGAHDERAISASDAHGQNSTDGNGDAGKFKQPHAPIPSGIYAASLIVTPRGSTPIFERDGNGRIESNMACMTLAIACPDFIGYGLSYDLFMSCVMIAPIGTADWRQLNDADYTTIRINLENRGFKKPTRDNTREAVYFVAWQNKIDIAITWLNALTWDGVPRVDKFLDDYFHVEPSPYHDAVSRYLWTALAGRILAPGCQADMVPVFVGEQGVRKTSLVATLAPAIQHCGLVDLKKYDCPNQMRKLRGKVVAEIAELKGINSAEQESIKEYITRRREEWVVKFSEFPITVDRRFLMIGTTNEKHGFLSDPTGNRRWLPVQLTEREIDVEKIEEIKLQLWAEAAHIWRAEGIAWKDAETLAKGVLGDYMIRDEWQYQIEDYLEGRDDGETLTRGEGINTTRTIAIRALGLTDRDINMPLQKRICRIMTILGYEHKKHSVGLKDRDPMRPIRFMGWGKKKADYVSGLIYRPDLI